MKKIIAAFALLFLGGLVLAPSASATGDDQPSADNKKITFCHATGSETNPYNKITTSISAFINAGHIGGGQPGTHDGDIYPAFSYTTKGGEVVNVPAQGDQSLLEFDDCQKPKEDTPVAKPDATFVDKCDTKNDVFSVAPGTGYTVGAVQTDGVIQVITVTLNEGFVWADGTKDALRFERPVFTDVDCDLPETGLGATFNTTGGYAALAALMLGGAMLLTGGRLRRN